jgi:integrase/recombinase XerD
VGKNELKFSLGDCQNPTKMATFKLALDMRRAKKDGTYPLVFKLTVRREKSNITTGISVLPHTFDAESNLILGNAKANELLMRLDMQYRTRFYQYIISNQGSESIKAAKDYILNKQPVEFTVAEYWCSIIKTMKEMGRDGGVKVYEQSLSTISQELNLNVPFSKITYNDIINLEVKLYKRGMSVNGSSVYLRTFRAVCNRAISQDLVSMDWYPFRKHRMKKVKTVPRVISIEELKSYFSLELPVEHPSFYYYNIGKLIFMLRGINLRDLLLLKPENIKHGRLIYRRAKTGKLYSIKVTDEIRDVVLKFTPNDTVLGLLKTYQLVSEKKINYFQQRVKVINKHLRKIGNMLELNEPLTSYVFRYTYANVAKQLGYSKDMIAEALGHEYGNNITGIYLEQYDNKALDDMNEAIIESVTKVNGEL